MAETVIPIGNFKAHCPKCGSELGIDRKGAEVNGEDDLVCPVHGTVTTVNEFRYKFAEENRDLIRKKANNVVEDMLRRAGFNPKRK